MESQSYGASPAIWDHTVLPATRHRWARPTEQYEHKLALFAFIIGQDLDQD